MNFKTTGIVLKEQSISENDKLVTLLTKDRGIIKAFARGAKSPKSRKNAGTQSLCYCDFYIANYSVKNIYSIEEAVVKETFFSLRTDLKKLSLAQYFCDVCFELAPREEDSSEYLSLILNSIYLLTTNKKAPELLKSVFELRMLSISGFMPDLVACKTCGKFESGVMFFNINSGELFCSECNSNQYNTPLSISAVTAMRHVVFSEKEKMFSFSLSGNSLKDFNEVVERYLLHVTMKNFKTLEFYKMIE